MLAYSLKSTACLIVLFLFYKIFLEKESIHTFKRFYLIGALILSLAIPLMVFVEYVTVPMPQGLDSLNPIQAGEVLEVKEAPGSPIDFIVIAWCIYGLGVLLFGLKFAQNLIRITNRIRKNPKNRLPHCTHVLHREKIPPHTFLKFIFLNKQKLENNEIPKEVLIHEETHVAQKHSWDVIFIELVQVLLWFNPLVVFFKRAIKLNHEFLADQAVLSKSANTINYQNVLLEYSTTNFQPALSNAIHYSSTRLTVFGKTFVFGSAFRQVKKRLTVMKTKTSKQSVLIKSLLLLPILALLLLGFSDKKTVSQASNEVTPITIKVSENHELFIEGKRIRLKKLSDKLNSMSKSNDFSNNSKPQVELEFEGDFSIELLKQIKKELAKTPATLTLVSADRIKFSEKALDQSFKGTQFRARDTLLIQLVDGDTILGTSTPRTQEGASRKLMVEYNKLAKYYNSMAKNNMRVLLKDVERLTYIRGLMSEKQQKDAEPFPDFPNPPPPVKKVGTTEIEEVPPPPPPNRVDEIKEVPPTPSNDNEIKEVPPPTPTSEIIEIPGSAEWPRVPMIAYLVNKGPISAELKKLADSYAKQKKSYYDGVVRFVEHEQGSREQLMHQYTQIMALHKSYTKLAVAEGVYASPEPSMSRMVWDRLPPHSQKLIDHVVGLAEKGAVFYLDDKKISTEKAIEQLKNNHELRINSMFEKNNIMEVKMSSS
ncbi:M56 family metallopeptidase [Flagellimonas myxillae]|uniref:M56 family metallopeptidase n=1 Tax=Flagellimonas myxillae TaxID=2942214 RepID=UPI00201ED9DB|nr:M56 family metallopeptidase [Muricauda myxillae]MCL6267177.1 M56 family metallopeptidase [Muricauda myxillae]